MQSIIDQMVDMRTKQRQRTMLACLRGWFGSGATEAGAGGALAPMRVDNFDESGNDAMGDQMMSVDLFINAKTLLGELVDSLRYGAIWLHPNILASLENQDVTAFKEKSLGAFTIKTYREMPIFASEALARPGAESGYVYETYLLSNGIIGIGEKPQAGDVIDVASLQYFLDRDKNNDMIWDRTRFLLHLNGIKWRPQPGVPAKQSATNAELQDLTNWELAFKTANRCGTVCIRTNG
jgi:hypothetical protein